MRCVTHLGWKGGKKETRGKTSEPRRNFEYTASPAALISQPSLPSFAVRIRGEFENHVDAPIADSRLFLSHVEGRPFPPLPFLDAHHKRLLLPEHFIVDSCFTPFACFRRSSIRDIFVADDR